MKNLPAKQPKQPAQGQKPQNRAGGDAQEKEQPELTQPHIQGKQQAACQHAQAEQQIQRMRQSAKALAQHPQHVIKHACRNAQQHRQQKLKGL